MTQPTNLRDLALRLLVIFFTSMVFLFLTRDNIFDLQFKIRKQQAVHADFLIIEVAENQPMERVVQDLKTQQVDRIYVSHFLYDEADPWVQPYILGESHLQFLSLELPGEDDGLVRRVRFFNSGAGTPKTLTINFRGPESSFPVINYYDFSASSMKLKDKKVILKSNKPINEYTTPVGLMSEAELVATLLDNQLADRFIPPKQYFVAVLILLILLALTTLFLIYLPSSLALVSTIVLAVTYLSVSLWTFDVFYYWTPIVSPLVQMILTFLLISNYKYVLNEKTRWSLERESLVLSQLEEMKTNFLSLFSHDFKTPLAKILGIVDTLKSKVDDPEILQELEKIDQSSKELDKYIKKILKLSQIQSKNISLNKEPTDINTLIDQAIKQNIHLAQKKNISIIKQQTPLFMIDVDGSLIKEVIVNFIENAITYSPEHTEIVVASDETDPFVKVSVKDQGAGIPKEYHDSIWEKSVRFDNQKTGYGLGLFLSRYVIHLHGGQVFLNSSENSGSEFGFLLPLQEEEKDETS